MATWNSSYYSWYFANEFAVLVGIEKICPTCAKQFRYCENCWRGHRYCSSTCSLEGRKQNRRRTEKKYAATPKGRENRRQRQKNFRIRCILKLKVTDQSPYLQQNIINQTSDSSPRILKNCKQCQRSVLVIKNLQSKNENIFFSFVRFKTNRRLQYEENYDCSKMEPEN